MHMLSTWYGSGYLGARERCVGASAHQRAGDMPGTMTTREREQAAHR